MSRSARGALAGAIGGVLAVTLMLRGTLTAGFPVVALALWERALRLMPMEVFGFLIVRLKFLAKPLALWGALVCRGGGAGVGRAGRLRPHLCARRDRVRGVARAPACRRCGRSGRRRRLPTRTAAPGAGPRLRGARRVGPGPLARRCGAARRGSRAGHLLADPGAAARGHAHPPVLRRPQEPARIRSGAGGGDVAAGGADE